MRNPVSVTAVDTDCGANAFGKRNIDPNSKTRDDNLQYNFNSKNNTYTIRV